MAPSGASYAANIANSGALVFNTPVSQNLGGNISGTGGLYLNNVNGNTTLSGSNNYSGPTVVANGNLYIAGSASLSPSTAVNVSDTLIFSNSQASVANAITLNGGAYLSNYSSTGMTLSGVTMPTSGTLNLNADGSLANGAMTISNSLAGTGPLTFNVGLTGDVNGTVTLSGNISGGTVVSLTLGSSGLLALTGNNTYSGSTAITAGTLQVGNGSLGYLGSNGNYAAAIANSGALVVNTLSNQTFGGAISGSGNLYQADNNLTTLAGNNSYTGSTTITAGTLAIGGNGSLGNYGANIANGSAPGGQHQRQREPSAASFPATGTCISKAAASQPWPAKTFTPA